MSERGKKTKPIITVVNLDDFMYPKFYELENGYEVELIQTRNPSLIADSWADIIYLGIPHEIGKGGMAPHSIASHVRDRNKRVKIGFFDFSDVYGEDLERFFEECRSYSEAFRGYLARHKFSHVIQGNPSTETLNEIISNTLNDQPVKTEYDNTRVVLPSWFFVDNS